MKNSMMVFILIILVIALGGFVFVNGKNEVTANVLPNEGQAIQGQVQKVVLSQSGYNYGDATAQAGKPISISADGSVRGCLRAASFNIDGKRYTKYLRTTEDTLELPALSKGTYNFACSMGMGYGKLIVE